MSILKNTKIAALVLAAVILIMTPVGAVRSLNGIADDVEEMFYTGVGTPSSIDSYLNDRVKKALGLVTVGADIDAVSAETDALRTAREALIEAETIEDKYIANEMVEKAYNDPLVAIYASTDDLDALADADAYATDLENIQGAISKNGYNAKVDEFYDETLGRFPASLFSGLISGPEPFGD